MKKRILSIMLICLIALSCMSTATFAAVTSGAVNAESTVMWRFDDETGVMTIFGGGHFANVTWPTEINNDIKSVVIEDGVLDITTNAFSDCVNLESVSIADSVKYIYGYAFSNCKKLKSITLPDNLEGISYAFVGCTALESISISEENPYHKTVDGVLYNKDMTYLFAYPVAKTDKTYVAPKTLRVIEDEAFYGCAALETVILHEGVNKISYYAFGECSALKNIDISNVTDLEQGVFYNCDSLTRAVVNEKVENLEYEVFYGCDNLEYLEKKGSINYISYNAFTDCPKLKTIIIPDATRYIYKEVFYNTAFYADPANWHDGILYCGNHAIDVTDEVSGEVRFKEGTVGIACSFAYAKSAITTVKIPESIKYVGYSAFEGCENLSVIELHPDIQAIACNTFLGTAYTAVLENWDDDLLYIDGYLLYCDNANAEYTVKDGTIAIADDAFFDCDLMKISIPGSVKRIGYSAFGECLDLVEVEFKDEGLVEISDDAFYHCEYLENINLPSTLKKIGAAAFQNCFLLEDVKFYDGLEFIGNNAFNDCETFTEIEVPESVTYIGASAFEDCENVVSAKLPKGLTEIPDDTFKDCYALETVILPDAFTTIGDEAFEDVAIESITLPYTLEYIDENAFYDCDDLEEVNFLGTKEEWDEVLIEKIGNEDLFNATINFHTHTVDEYVYNGDADFDNDGTETGVCTGCKREITRTKEGSKLELVDTSKKFKDVKDSAWYKEFVDYAYSVGMFNGTSENTFEPNAAVSRAMFVTVISRVAGATVDNTAKTKFTDVQTGRYYTGAVAWAAENEIVKGITDTEFDPNADVTREQMCTLLVRYADFAGVELTATADKITFKDEGKIANYAKAAVETCQKAGIVNGKTANEFAPKESATRAQVAKILTVFVRDFIDA